jgi:predicted ATPase
VRGEILLRRDRESLKPAEDAFRSAVAVARAQKARSFELRAALALAKLYRATNRHADAYSLLAPVLENFPLAAELPEILEGKELLANINSGVRTQSDFRLWPGPIVPDGGNDRRH